MSVEGEKKTKPRWRWFQFSLRALLLLMTVFGIWFGIRMDRARRQKRAVAVLQECGDIFYESQFNHRSVKFLAKKTKPWRPKWLRAIVGDDFFDRVYAAYLYRSPSDEDLKSLRDLPDIETLIISSPQVTGKGIEHLRALPRLKELYLNCDKMTDTDLVHLPPLDELRYLNVCCSMSDQAFDSIAALESLETLEIARRPPSSAGSRAAIELDQPTQVKADDEPLASVLDYLKDFHNIDFPVDEAQVRTAGIEWWDIPISCTCSGESLELALDAILQDTGLDWILTHDGILITTEEKAADRLAAVRALKTRLPNLKRVVCFVDP